MLNPAFLITLFSITSTSALISYVLIDELLLGPAGGSALVIMMAAVIGACLLLNVRRLDDRYVTLQKDQLLIPLPWAFGRCTRRVSFDELSSIELTRPMSGSQLKLNIRGRLPVTICRRQLSCGNLERFHDVLFASASAANPHLLTARRLFLRRNRVPWVSVLTSMIIVLVFLISASEQDDPVHRLIVVGGLNDWLIDHGEAFRFGAAALLHADLAHLLINVSLLLIIGLRLEYVTGGLRLAGAMLTGMLAGNLAAYMVGGQTVVIGASGGIFAVLGLYAHTLYARRRHLPTRTQFAHNLYLLAGLAILFVPLPGYAQSVHVGGFIGGLSWSLLVPFLPRVVPLTLIVAASAFVGWSSWFGLTHADAWEENEPRLIEEMARDPTAGMGTLDLVGWYALQHENIELMRMARRRLEALPELDASAAGTLAELLLEHGDTRGAARWANRSFELDGGREARELLMRAELAAYAESCVPIDYAATRADPPLPIVDHGQLTFVSPRPLYVHARVNHHYVVAPTDVRVETVMPDASAVTVLGYSDRLPLRRKPRVLLLTGASLEESCGAAGSPTS